MVGVGVGGDEVCLFGDLLADDVEVLEFEGHPVFVFVFYNGEFDEIVAAMLDGVMVTSSVSTLQSEQSGRSQVWQ